MEKYIEKQMNEWLENESPQFREAVKIAIRNSNNGDFYATEIGYGHKCKEPEKLGKAECCFNAGAETLINPAFWQEIKATARAVGMSVEEVWGRPNDWYEDEDIKLSKKYKRTDTRN